MENTIDMQSMRYLNLFNKITQVSTRFCFKYNETIIFCVSKYEISKAIGEGGRNVKQLSEILRKRVKIIPSPRGVQDVKFFIESIVNPVTFRDIQTTDDEIVITAGSMQVKAALMGRNKKRMEEMQSIIKNYFHREFRII